MKFESLKKFLTGLISPEVFAAEILPEIKEFRKKSKEKGTSRPIYLSDEKGNFEVSRNEVLTLSNAFLNGYITDWHLYYICDALQLSNSIDFKDEDISDAIASMTDPEINGAIDKDSVLKIKNRLRGVP